MNTKTTLIAAALAALLAAGPASAVDPLHNGALATPANRIVGLWTTDGMVSPCGTALPPTAVRNTLLFEAGGTVVENPRFPPQGANGAFGVAGINQRGNGLGTWSYDPADHLYTLHLRFDWYVNGAYHGYQTVDREMRLSSDGMQVSGDVTSTRFAANGTPLISVCGAAVSDRI
jgi:hypothetical protein